MQDPDTADIYLCILIGSGDIVSFCIYDPAGFSGKARDPAFLPIQFHTVEQAGGNGYFFPPCLFVTVTAFVFLLFRAAVRFGSFRPFLGVSS